MMRTIGGWAVALVLGLVVGCGERGSDEAAPPVGADTADVTAGGPSTIRVPIVETIEVKKSKRIRKLIAERNPELQKVGLPPFPESLTVRATNHDKDTDDFLALSARADEAAEKLKLKDGIEMIAFSDGSEIEGPFGKNKITLCYTGGAKQAVELVQNMTDSVFSDQFVLHGWRFKKQVFDGDGAAVKPADQDAFAAGMPDVWKEWRGDGDAILLVSSTSDGGEEANPTILRKCR